MNFSPWRDHRFVRVAAFIAALATLLVLAWLVYRPGLSGDFLFDDFGTLPALGATGPVTHWATFWRYITSGNADPTGRPLTLLTFLINARDWPAAPYPFKITNVLLHLLNAALLCAVLLRLGRALHLDSRHARTAALFGAGAWLLHPLLVSTTLYVVQREAMLPATFVLIGMLGWISARGALSRGHVWRGSLGMLIAAWGCTLMAVLSKANGALLPLLLLLIEWIVLMPNQPIPSELLERRRKRLVAVLLWLPVALLALYLITRLPGAVGFTESTRNWTLAQRVLSEPRALCNYLALLFAPRAVSTGLFTDAFHVSTNPLHPWTTLPCITIVLGLIAIAFALRKRHPAIALALLFYFAAQLLESTWIPLELYYEHRNYLPAMLLFWPIGIGLGAPGAMRWLRGLCAVAILAWLAMLTFQRASLWGDGYKQALVWAAFNPDSARAQTAAADYDMHHGRPRVAAARLRNALPQHPNDIQAPLNLIGAECKLGSVRPQSLVALRVALAHDKVGGQVAFNWFEDALDLVAHHACEGLGYPALQSMIDAARANPYWRNQSGRQQDLDHMQGQLELALGHPQQALADFNHALAVTPRVDAALKQAAILGSSGYPKLGLQHLDYFTTLPQSSGPGLGMPMIHAWILSRQNYWANETTHLRAILRADAAARSGEPAGEKG